MPNWNAPLLPAEKIQPIQEKLESPRLNRQPWEARLRGFGSGALEGLRNLSKPTNIASLALLAAPGVGEVAGIGRATNMAPEAITGLQTALGKVPQAAETLGEVAPEFTPVGAEGFYNLGKQTLKGVSGPLESVYTRILAAGGR